MNQLVITIYDYETSYFYAGDTDECSYDRSSLAYYGWTKDYTVVIL